ncbi:MAG: RDD family protein [Rhodanobacteraceae bacterium]
MPFVRWWNAVARLARPALAKQPGPQHPASGARQRSQCHSRHWQSALTPPLWRRLTAMLYDVFPLIALWMITAFVCLQAMARFGKLDATRAPWWEQLALLAVTAAYFVISWTRIGQTIGMRAWRLKLLRKNGERIEVWRALARFFLALVSLLIAGIGFWWALFDAQKRTLHDRVCGTVMMRLNI